MGKHRRPSRGRLRPGFLLSMSALSVVSPVGLILALPSAVETETVSSPKTPTQTIPNLPVVRAELATSSTTTRAKATKRVPISTPTATAATTATTTTRPTRPTVAQRQIQKTTTATTTSQQTKIVVTPSPKSQIHKQTSTTTTTATTTKKTTQATTTKSELTGTERLVTIAKKYVSKGIPYQRGGNSLSDGMDCSHFVWMVLKEEGLNVPYRDSSALAQWVTHTSNPQPGDLVLYSGHVGIYAGAGMMIDQGKAGGAFLQKVYTQNLIGYGRIP